MDRLNDECHCLAVRGVPLSKASPSCAMLGIYEIVDGGNYRGGYAPSYYPGVKYPHDTTPKPEWGR
uniref:Uncharacterized protein n=1 Tax=Carrot red leaf virus associated RNA TaxID=1425368 RepID=A0A6H2MW12_9VIRU|nr:hypothetical protein [Carrot red leaf virus associated RNA]